MALATHLGKSLSVYIVSKKAEHISSHVQVNELSEGIVEAW